MANVDYWEADGWEADWFSPYLCLTSPAGEVATVGLKDTETGRNITLSQFRSSVKSHGVKKACEVFWKLRAKG